MNTRGKKSLLDGETARVNKPLSRFHKNLKCFESVWCCVAAAAVVAVVALHQMAIL